MNLLSFLRKRLLQILPVLFGIALVVFLVVRLIPGDPARIMLGTRATEERLVALRERWGSACRSGNSSSASLATSCRGIWARRWSTGAT